MADRLDLLNLSKFISGMGTGVSENLGDEEALRDYASQLWSVGEELGEAVRERREIDWDSLNDSIGTDIIENVEVYP